MSNYAKISRIDLLATIETLANMYFDSATNDAISTQETAQALKIISLLLPVKEAEFIYQLGESSEANNEPVDWSEHIDELNKLFASQGLEVRQANCQQSVDSLGLNGVRKGE